MSTNKFKCPNPCCESIRNTFTERGLFRHLDTSSKCRTFTNLRVLPSRSSLPTGGVTGLAASSNRSRTLMLPSSGYTTSQDSDGDMDVQPSMTEEGETTIHQFSSPTQMFPENINISELDIHSDSEPYSSHAQLARREESVATGDVGPISLEDSMEPDSDANSSNSVRSLEINLPVTYETADDDSDNDSDFLSDDMSSSCDQSEEVSSTSEHSNDNRVLDNTAGCTNELTNSCDSVTDPVLGNRVQIITKRPQATYSLVTPERAGYTTRQWILEWIAWAGRPRGEKEDKYSDERPDNLYLLTKFISDPNYLPGWNFISSPEMAEIKLMSTLNEIKGCPLYVYDSVIEWTRRSLGSNQPGDSDADVTTRMMRNRKEFLKSAPTFAHTSDMHPKTRKIFLPGCNQSVSLTTIPYMANLYNCLTSGELVNDESLLLPGATPHENPPTQFSSQFDDINTGSRYLKSWFSMKVDDIDFPLGDLFFVDKSVLDVNGRLSAEPVNHTFTLLNRKTRYMSSAWYSLGCIPNQKGLSYGSDTNPKVQDYHHVLSEILREYKHLQTEYRGILWPLLFRGKYYMVRFRPYVMACLGDTPGQNMMTGKMGSSRCQRLCRYCDVEKTSLSNPWQSYTLMTKAFQDRIQASDTLRTKYSYKKVDVVWNSLYFGVKEESIHTNVPGELLHAFQKGILVRVIECLLSTRTRNKAGMEADQKRVASIMAKKKGSSRDDFITDLIKTGAFGGQWTLMVDNLSRALGAMIAQQSEHNMPRTHFSQGIVHHSKTTAAEQQGIAFLFNIILCSTWAVETDGLGFRLGTGRLGGYICILEKLLCLEELLKCHSGKSNKTLSRAHMPMIVHHVKQLLDQVKKVADRKVGDGFDIIKFHLIIHMFADDIPRYGSPANVSGGPGETQFKKNFKNPGSTTQQNDATFIDQMCMRKFQHHTTARCAYRVERMEKYSVSSTAQDDYRLNPLSSLSIRPLKRLAPHFGSVLNLVDAGCHDRNSDGTAIPILEQTNLPPTGLSGRHYVFFLAPSTSTSLPRNNGNSRIAYRGRKGSGRFEIFTNGGKDLSPPLVDINGSQMGCKGCPSLTGANDGFRDICEFLTSTFGKAGYKQPISLYTAFRVAQKIHQENPTIYRSDPCCHLGFKERYDWALFDTKQGLRVGQIMSFLVLTQEMIDSFNASLPTDHGRIVDAPGGYALVQLFNRTVPGLVDPSFQAHTSANVMQANSVLLFFGTKQQKNGKAVTRILPLYKIQRPLVVLPDFHPKFTSASTGCSITEMNINKSRRNSFIVVRPRDLWHEVFVNQAISEYQKLKRR